MLQVRLDDYGAQGTAHFDKTAAQSGAKDLRLGGRLQPVGELHFNQVVAILRRRSALVLAIAGIGTALAIIVGLLIPPKYTALAQLVIDSPPNSAVEHVPGVSVMDENIDTHVTLLSSRDHLQRVIESLLQASEFQPSMTNSALPEPTRPSTSNDESQVTALRPPMSSTAAQTTALGELKHRVNVWLGALRRSGSSVVPSIEEFERNTRVLQERRSRVITVGFTSTSPEKAAAFANRIVQLYVDGLMEQKRASASREMDRLDERIAEAKNGAERAASAVQKAIQRGPGSEQNAGSEMRGADGQLRELLHRAGSSAQLYDTLLRRRKEARDRQETVAAGVGIHLLAGVPNRPSSHNPILFIVPAFVLFAIGGSGLAIVLEQLDRGLRSEQDVRDALGVSCIGLVPLLSRRQAVRPHQYLLAQPSSAYAEAIRSAIATLGFVSGSPRSCKVILISSSIAGEGKTTLAVSLAAYLGILGRRVVLLDLNASRGTPIGVLKDSGERSLDLSPHSRPAALLTRHIAEARFDYLSMANCGLDPLVLFAREQMPRLVRQLRESYDCVIVDGPAVLGSAEARLLPSIADKVLFVVKWGSTRRELAQNALGLLHDCCCEDRGDRASAIVTQVNLKKHARYRYGDVGEFLAKHTAGRARFGEARTSVVGGNGSTAGARDEQLHRPKVPGEETDGCSV